MRLYQAIDPSYYRTGSYLVQSQILGAFKNDAAFLYFAI